MEKAFNDIEDNYFMQYEVNMKNRLTYEETEQFMTKFLMQSNVIFKLDEKSTLPWPAFDIFINDTKRKDIFLTLDEAYHFVTLVFRTKDFDEYKLNNTDLFVKVSQAKKEYDDNKIIEQEKNNFELLKLLTGE